MEFLVILAVYIVAFVLVGLVAYGVAVCALLAQAAAKAVCESRPGQKVGALIVGHFGSWTRGVYGYDGDRGAKTASKRLSHFSYLGGSLATRHRKLGYVVTETILLTIRIRKEAEEEEDRLDALQDRLENSKRNRPEFGWDDSPRHGRRSTGWKEHRSYQHH